MYIIESFKINTEEINIDSINEVIHIHGYKDCPVLVLNNNMFLIFPSITVLNNVMSRYGVPGNVDDSIGYEKYGGIDYDRFWKEASGKVIDDVEPKAEYVYSNKIIIEASLIMTEEDEDPVVLLVAE